MFRRYIKQICGFCCSTNGIAEDLVEATSHMKKIINKTQNISFISEL